MTLTNVEIAPELATLFNNQIYQGLEVMMKRSVLEKMAHETMFHKLYLSLTVNTPLGRKVDDIFFG
jgi:hypothetical protein